MPSKAPSNANHPPAGTDDSRAKRQRSGVNATPSSSSASTIVVSLKNLPHLEGAMTTVVTPYVQTLHKELQPYFAKTIKSLFQTYLTWYWKDKKHQKMSHDSTYVPASCRVGPTLNVIHEVQQSKDFTALNAQLSASTNTVQLGYAKLAKNAHELNTKALHKKILDIYSALLHVDCSTWTWRDRKSVV